MADNFQVRDGNGNLITMKSKDTTGSGGPQAPQSTPSDATGNPYSDTNPSAVAVQARQVTYTDRSGTLSGTTSQQIVAVNANRRGFWIQNQDTSNNLFINFGTAAAAGTGVLIPPYSIYELPLHMVPTTAIYAIGVNGQVYSAKEC